MNASFIDAFWAHFDQRFKFSIEPRVPKIHNAPRNIRVDYTLLWKICYSS